MTYAVNRTATSTNSLTPDIAGQIYEAEFDMSIYSATFRITPGDDTNYRAYLSKMSCSGSSCTPVANSGRRTLINNRIDVGIQTGISTDIELTFDPNNNHFGANDANVWREPLEVQKGEFFAFYLHGFNVTVTDGLNGASTATVEQHVGAHDVAFDAISRTGSINATDTPNVSHQLVAGTNYLSTSTFVYRQTIGYVAHAHGCWW